MIKNCSLLQHNTMESLLERGEKLDDLVAKSEHLGNQSKAFYKTVSLFISSVLTFGSEPKFKCVFFYPSGTETELVLWNHVMPLPCPVGTRLSLPFCFSYNSHHASVTSASRGPRLRRSTESGKRVFRSMMGLMGAEGAMRFSQGKSFNLITNSPLKASVWSVPAHFVYWKCLWTIKCSFDWTWS